MTINFKQILSYLNPSPNIAGLEISDSGLFFLKINIDGKITQNSLRLPPGIIVDGKVKDKKNFIEALSQLRKQIKADKKDVFVIVTIGANHVYSQVFNLPPLSSTEKMEEAAVLNLRMISPIDAQKSYSDWQMINNKPTNGGQLELLGAFIEKGLAEEYLSALAAANFLVAAMEFIPLSIIRALKKVSSLESNKPQIILLVKNDGLDFMILKNGNLYFNRFVIWVKNISMQSLLDAEIQKIINFYYSRWGEMITNLILISPTPIQEVKDAFKNIKIEVKEWSVDNISSVWLGSLGAALRGQLSRAEDNLISLTSVGTEKEYHRQQIFYFAEVWKNILFTSLGAIAIINIIIYWFLWTMNNSLAAQTLKSKIIPIGSNLEFLEEKAKTFNNIINKAQLAKQYSPKWASAINKLLAFSGPNIVLTRLHFDPPSLIISLNGAGSSETEIISFKNRLAKDSLVENVDLPLSQISHEGGKIIFQISLKLLPHF